MPLSLLAAAHMAIEEVEATKTGSHRLTPSDKILRIRIESVGLLKEPSAPDLDERAHAKAIVKHSHIPVATAMNSDHLDCASLSIRRRDLGLELAARTVMLGCGLGLAARIVTLGCSIRIGGPWKL